MISFTNSSLLDLHALTTMGVSVKETDSPIGRFGTGLKFAVATLLRTGHEVEIWLQGQEHKLSTLPREIRSKIFQIIHLDGAPLGFTTELGKDWEVWQAFRELGSNVMDEPDGQMTSEAIHPRDFSTCIRVRGAGIEKAFAERHTVFLDSPAIEVLSGVCELHQGPSRYLYFRGIRVWELPKPSIFTWNILSQVSLTEDRTLKYEYEAKSPMGRLAGMVASREILESLLRASKTTYEFDLDFAYAYQISDTFQSTLTALSHDVTINISAKRQWRNKNPLAEVYHEAKLDQQDQEALRKATALCTRIDPNFQAMPLVVQDLGLGIYGLAKEGKIYLAHSCFAMGLDFLAATLYEEYLHIKHGFVDKTTEFQNYLFQQIIRLAHRAIGEAVPPAPPGPSSRLLGDEIPF